jgi:hypothetical protein
MRLGKNFSTKKEVLASLPVSDPGFEYGFEDGFES